MGYRFLLQGMFPTQGLNPCLVHWQVDSLPLSYQESPIIVYVLCNCIMCINSVLIVCVKVKVAQLCLTLCDPMDYTVHAILQAKILEWVVFPFSRGSSQPRN